MFNHFDEDTNKVINDNLELYKTFLAERYNLYGAKLSPHPADWKLLEPHYIAFKQLFP